MTSEISGKVQHAKIETSIGDLLLNSEDCVDKIELRSIYDVRLYYTLNHKSEDIKIESVSEFSPEEARSLGRLLIDAADTSEKLREAEDQMFSNLE